LSDQIVAFAFDRSHQAQFGNTTEMLE